MTAADALARLDELATHLPRVTRVLLRDVRALLEADDREAALAATATLRSTSESAAVVLAALSKADQLRVQQAVAGQRPPAPTGWAPPKTKVNKAPLSKSVSIEIARRRHQGERCIHLAAEFGCVPSTISKIARRYPPAVKA